MSHAITRCPNCATSFRITQAQLKTAKGAVRCGSCLTVFQAAKHLIKEIQPEIQAKLKQGTKQNVNKQAASQIKSNGSSQNKQSVLKSGAGVKTPAKPAAKRSAIPTSDLKGKTHVSLETLNDLDARASISPKPNAPSTNSPSRTHTSARGKSASSVSQSKKALNVKETTAVRKAIGDSQLRASPSSGKKALKSQKSSEGKATAKPKEAFPVDEDELDNVLISDDMDGPDQYGDEIYMTGTSTALTHSLFERDPTKRQEGSEYESDDSWALGLLDEDEERIRQQAARSKSGEGVNVNSHQEVELDLSGKSIYSDQETEFHEDFMLATTDNSQDDSRNGHSALKEQADDDVDEPVFEFDEPIEDRETDTHYSLFQDIEPEPVEFTYKHKRPFWRTRAFFSVLAILCLLGLIAQAAIMRFDTLALKEPYRHFYGYACKLIGCELPDRNDISKIRINQLMVRSHPTTANALIVDAVILNNALFKQKFPDLTLTFTDIKNKPIASRSFTPSEYLEGELKGQALMPSLQPITLNFQIVDPGSTAVNYLLTIAP